MGPKRTVADGPFADATALLAGFWIIDVHSKEEAIDWAKRVPFDEGVVEVRQLEELADFPVELQRALGPSEEALRKQLEQRKRV